ncbi:hypothetical protein C4H03_RS23070, partial [Vibrio parahaemolyticus]|nr:hypothetical protein [Vibrio parahaemolyticus]EJG1105952.1 hypothetical protein [Vibrio parahaemolyticus]ELA6668479.1 hypothetical protein [Vibrio parahaemolyticus]
VVILDIKKLRYRKTAIELNSVAIELFKMLFVNFVIFYILIGQKSYLESSGDLDLNNALKYAFNTLYNNYVYYWSLSIGILSFLGAILIRPPKRIRGCSIRKAAFIILRWLSQSFLSVAITLALFKYVALTHGNFTKQASFLDFALFLIAVFIYIALDFYLRFDSKEAANKNISNVVEALKFIGLTIIGMIFISALIFVEIKCGILRSFVEQFT